MIQYSQVTTAGTLGSDSPPTTDAKIHRGNYGPGIMMEPSGRSRNCQGHKIDNGLPSPGTNLLRNMTKADVTAIQFCGCTDNDICSRCMVHPHLQARRPKEKQQLLQSNTQASIHPEDGLHHNYRGPTHNSHRNPGATCRPTPDRPPIPQGMPPSGSENCLTPEHAPLSCHHLTASKKDTSRHTEPRYTN
jgi:hypothetical protein